ncbi:predicted protein [Scheffersomyces stipitis CBS 6054]|uniref:Uncharacterized protein n=1 Tax=Scheffersomyces stipitis (strain ATCC 58785 / CBS 6054 / NBRC 10063 / NRRL Y-11545) TaxID=322104 RepID=A3LUQ5_PICST|nr:predicted protein [Scheffersomyces stipitis CBS 6054]ABN66631.2 predicted protein [Scheffersomyces stipitis CBS 6054]
MSEIISIPTTSTHGGATYYHVAIKLPLRSLTVQRRYSEFEDLVNGLCDNLGINVKDFPYELPSKRINWFKSNTQNIISERKAELSRFLNQAIRDSTIQNSALLHKFLSLPVNFRFNSNLFNNNVNESTHSSVLSLDEGSIDESNWLEVLRVLRFSIQDSDVSANNAKIGDKIQIRDKINKLFQPCFVKLLSTLNGKLKKELPTDEFSRRQALLKEIQANLQHLVSTSRRVLGGPKETKDTVGLSNQDLLQQQVQIHRQQDQEVEQLRMIISRQRQIGEMINAEVEEQNAMLDQFNEEVERASDKVQSARNRARNIL